MRLFVAIDIDDDTRRQLAAARDAIRAVVDRARVPPRVTWVKAEAAHVTVRFIGETPDHTSRAIEQAIAHPFETAPFDIRWERLATFRGRRGPSVIWIGSSADTDAIARLAGEIDQRLDPLVGAGESRPLKPHVTLGRVKDPGKGVDWPRALVARAWVPTTTHVDHVTLYVSRTLADGATYTPLCKVAL